MPRAWEDCFRTLWPAQDQSDQPEAVLSSTSDNHFISPSMSLEAPYPVFQPDPVRSPFSLGVRISWELGEVSLFSAPYPTGEAKSRPKWYHKIWCSWEFLEALAYRIYRSTIDHHLSVGCRGNPLIRIISVSVPHLFVLSVHLAAKSFPSENPEVGEHMAGLGPKTCNAHLSSVQNPSIVPLYWLVYRDSAIGLYRL